MTEAPRPARLRELVEEMRGLADEPGVAKFAGDLIRKWADELEAVNEQRLARLTGYVQHKSECAKLERRAVMENDDEGNPYIWDYVTDDKRPCTCGLDAALAEIPRDDRFARLSGLVRKLREHEAFANLCDIEGCGCETSLLLIAIDEALTGEERSPSKET